MDASSLTRTGSPPQVYLLVQCRPGHVIFVADAARAIPGVDDVDVVQGAIDLIVRIGSDASAAVPALTELEGVVSAQPCFVRVRETVPG